ncbi:MAG TPA: response regulator [Gemmatimonadaceae bacterium]|nr:response regulator [Gemmatimonadaceae bacterium]
MNVLLADDDGTTRTLLAAAVRRLGHTVTAVSDGQTAWETFEREQHALVVADWQMPGLDGMDLCRRIRDAVGDRTFLLVVTGRSESHDLQRALDAGADDYLTKPVTLDHFRARIAIAERRLVVNAARRNAEAEVARMRWLSGIGHTVLALQHEVNTPLGALYGYLELLMNEVELSPTGIAHVTGALDQAKRISAVVRQLSELKRVSTVERVPGLPMLDLSAAGAVPV